MFSSSLLPLRSAKWGSLQHLASVAGLEALFFG